MSNSRIGNFGRQFSKEDARCGNRAGRGDIMSAKEADRNELRI
jgi:hypothetical protein